MKTIFVSINGHDGKGYGSKTRPLRTIGYAIKHYKQCSFTVCDNDGYRSIPFSLKYIIDQKEPECKTKTVLIKKCYCPCMIGTLVTEDMIYYPTGIFGG